jgi:hypothetical protein
VELHRGLNGALAGAVGAAVSAAQQPLDKRLFASGYDDLELPGKLVTRGDGWPAAGLALHLQKGALLGAAYAFARPVLPGPPLVIGVAAGVSEHLVLWPLVRLAESRHPRREELAPLAGNPRAFVQAAWRRLVFALVMSELERRLNAREDAKPPPIPVSSNGHGNIEAAVGAA